MNRVFTTFIKIILAIGLIIAIMMFLPNVVGKYPLIEIISYLVMSLLCIMQIVVLYKKS